jgi:hypothetical protein
MSFIRNSQSLARCHPSYTSSSYCCFVERRSRVDEASWSTVHLRRLSRGMTGAVVRIGALYFAIIALVAVLLLVWAKFGQ